MMTAEEAAMQRAEDYVRDRGWRHEPLTWEEVRDLLVAIEDDQWEQIDDLLDQVPKLPAKWRAAILDALT